MTRNISALIGKPVTLTRRGAPELVRSGLLLEIEPRGYLVQLDTGPRMGFVGDLWDINPAHTALAESDTPNRS